MEKFKNKYRIASSRHPNWDYSHRGLYFITICTQERAHFFGEIHHNEMLLSNIGNIAKAEWLKTFEMRPDMNLWMGEFVVMPNHFHAIIGIGDNEYNTVKIKSEVETQCIASLPHNNPPQNKFGPQSKNLASIVRGYKIGVTRNARKINPNFAWQPRYHDHIIRNDTSFQKISDYIKNNPSHWKDDTFYKSIDK